MRALAAAALLLALALASGLSLVWAREQARQADLGIRDQRDRLQRLDTEWGRLQLERAALAARPRVERLARERFDMHTPDSGEIWDFRP
ncbi:MAG TPA: cell division protein FtsL [Gammaproteobacteria bacterium]|nr:cell division protein FtsL [Gammaproteobacteria bacterium]